jgi:GIY-YIG catalytic domain
MATPHAENRREYICTRPVVKCPSDVKYLSDQCGFLHGHQPSLLRGYGWQASLGCGEAAKAARRSPQGEDGLASMKYVYLLQSIPFPDQSYVGLTDDLRARFSAHNKGRSPHTDKYKP